MARKANHKKPTESECLILNVLWQRKQATVREVFEALQKKTDMGYTTVLKFMQIMTEKGLLTRDTAVRPQIYSTAHSERQTQKTLVRDLVDRAFSGSPGNLALQALSLTKVSPTELKKIQRLLDDSQGGKP